MGIFNFFFNYCSQLSRGTNLSVDLIKWCPYVCNQRQSKKNLNETKTNFTENNSRNKDIK